MNQENMIKINKNNNNNNWCKSLISSDCRMNSPRILGSVKIQFFIYFNAIFKKIPQVRNFIFKLMIAFILNKLLVLLKGNTYVHKNSEMIVFAAIRSLYGAT